MRGAAKTLEQHLKDGSFRADRHGHLLPPGGLPAMLPKSGPPVKPAGLTAEQSRLWDAVVACLGDGLRAEDGILLLEFCRWHKYAADLDTALNACGATGAGFEELIKAAGKAGENLREISKRLGLSPADAARLAAKTGARDTSSPPKVATRGKTKLDRAAGPRSN